MIVLQSNELPSAKSAGIGKTSTGTARIECNGIRGNPSTGSGQASATPTKPRISLRYIRATSLRHFHFFSLRCPRSKTAGNYKLTQFAMALLVFLARSARARVVAAYLQPLAHKRFMLFTG